MKTWYGKWIEGKEVQVEIDDETGRIYIRKVRYRKDCGLFVVIKNKMYFEYEF